MSWFRRLRGEKAALTPAQTALLREYEALPAVAADADFRKTRFIVVDVETTGLDAYRDRLLAIGAVAVDSLLVRLRDSYTAILRQQTASSHENILVHGIDGTTQANAPAPVDGLLDFMRYAGKAPLVAFQAGFDRAVIERALRETCGAQLANQWLDVARLAPAYLAARTRASLDEWMLASGIENFRRHDALADALATAQLFQVVLARAAARGHAKLSDLAQAEEAQRWLERR